MKPFFRSLRQGRELGYCRDRWPTSPNSLGASSWNLPRRSLGKWPSCIDVRRSPQLPNASWIWLSRASTPLWTPEVADSKIGSPQAAAVKAKPVGWPSASLDRGSSLADHFRRQERCPNYMIHSQIKMPTTLATQKMPVSVETIPLEVVVTVHWSPDIECTWPFPLNCA